MTTPENPLTDWPTLQPWAVIGVSDNPEKYGHIIYRDLKTYGYRVYGVNPKLTTILGDPCYAALKDLPEVPAVVNLVIPPQATPAVLRECAELGITRVWFQPGAESDDALALAADLGLNVLANACIMLQKAPA